MHHGSDFGEIAEDDSRIIAPGCAVISIRERYIFIADESGEGGLVFRYNEERNIHMTEFKQLPCEMYSHERRCNIEIAAKKSATSVLAKFWNSSKGLMYSDSKKGFLNIPLGSRDPEAIIGNPLSITLLVTPVQRD